MARRNSTRSRAGVVLLVILSMLVLFALLGVTFAIVAGQYRKSAATFALRDQSGDEPGRQLDSAMYMVLRDTPNSKNPLRTTGLLTDMYGDFVKGHISNTPSAIAGGQFVEFEVQQNAPPAWPASANQVGFYNGCVLTFTSGVQKNVSTRIIGYRINNAGTAAIVRVLRPRGDGNDVLPANGDLVHINGRAFSGTGIGFNATTGKLDQLDPNLTSIPYALAPNRIGDPAIQSYLVGGANESYDAPDFQNPHLAAIVPDSSAAHGVKIVNGIPQIIPSFHRPALIRYQGGTPTTRNTFRPIPQAMGGTAGPNFPTLASWTDGPWDVDNDNDGLADSVWLDLDFPMQTSPDGRAYKPLFAILCVDMDGKLNLNYHGNFQHYAATGVNENVPVAGGGALSTATGMALGSGLGPGEVNLLHGLQGLTNAEYQQLLEGNGSIHGRYYGVVATPGGVWDRLDTERFFEIPAGYSVTGDPVGSYMSPPDLQGQLKTAVSHVGSLQTSFPTDTPTPADRRFNSVYRTRQPYDDRFTPAELERILRFYDIDSAALPRRLEYLTGNVFKGNVGAKNRRNVTVESRDLPVATAGPVMRNASTSAFEPVRDPLQLLRQKFREGMGGVEILDVELVKLVDPGLFHGLKMDLNRPLGDGQEPTAANQHNLIVDEPSDAEIIAQTSNGYDLVNGLEDANGNGTTHVLPADGEEQRMARYHLAKHLYILASLACEVNPTATPEQRVRLQYELAQWAVNVVDFRDADSIMTPFEFDIFPFVDNSPSPNGRPWNVDGLLGSDENMGSATPFRGVVWGCERPELLLTETLAMHDRRTSDTASEVTPIVNDESGDAAGTMTPTTTTDAMNPDEGYDQRFLPQGSLFIEIYNPQQSTVERKPAEFYADHSTVPPTWQPGVHLNAVTPGANGSPVWRILIVKGPNIDRDPDAEYPLVTDPTELIDPADRERSVYFANPAGVADNDGKRYFTNLPVAPLLPGRYAVIGSGQPKTGSAGEYVTYTGFPTMPGGDIAAYDDAVTDLTRQLVLRPDLDPTVSQFQVLNNGATRPEPAVGEIQSPIGIVINQVLNGATPADGRLSISEPVDGYTLPAPAVLDTALDHTGLIPFDDGSGSTAVVLDQPLDMASPERDVLMNDGTKEVHRILHLQRLANPLVEYHPVSNPYRTVDSIGADLTCFNGVEGGTEPDYGTTNANTPNCFETLQRGDHEALPVAPATPRRSLWTNTRKHLMLPMETPEQDTTHYWDQRLQHTLGYLNSSYGAFHTVDAPPYFAGDPAGDPVMPWLKWNNRPFNSIYELADVPRSRPSRLTREFSLPNSTPVPYSAEHDAANPVTFNHLINFYYVQPNSTTGMPSHMYRIFDYLRIPSKFVESDTYFADNFTTIAGTEGFHRPFNRYSNFRDPGMININTIYSQDTWNAVLNGATGPTFAELISSRRGYGASGGEILQSDAQYPTEFTNPFRAAGSGALVPPLTAPATMERNNVEVTMMRSKTIDAATTVPTTQPLFANDPVTHNLPYNDVTRHAGMRSSTLERLSNTLTTRSNVYAVWITMGYFEVDPNSGLLGQEVGTDTGEIRRHRAFYMIDRSIPVAFEPGENHNVDRAVLLRRFIE